MGKIFSNLRELIELIHFFIMTSCSEQYTSRLYSRVVLTSGKQFEIFLLPRNKILRAEIKIDEKTGSLI